MNRHIWFLQIKRQLGWSGAIGSVMLLLAIWVYGFGIVATQANIAEHELNIKQLKEKRAKLVRNTERVIKVSNEEPISTLPNVNGLPQELSVLLALVEQKNLELLAGDYKLGKSLNQDFVQYEIQLPLKGHYQDIRFFVDSLSTELPHASIKALNLKRESVKDSEIEARLNIVLYLRDQNSGVAP